MPKETTEKLTFNEKLLELQKRIKPIVKDSDNPFFKSKYVDINSILAEVKPIMSDLGLVLTQPIIISQGKNTLRTTISDSTNSDVITEVQGFIESDVFIPDNADIQKFGASVTYLRRFALVALLSLEAIDDDGNSASGVTREPSVPYSKPNPLFSQDPCDRCGALMSLSKTTGKMYCSAKCWLNQGVANTDSSPY